MTKAFFSNLKNDLPASMVVFLVALPLCLGISLASGAPLISGLIAGIIGGIVVGAISGSHTSVSGPAAGLAAVVYAAIHRLGTYETFLAAVVLAGLFQVLFGLLKAGIISHYFPSNVIKGLLAAIGIILILKQIPHAFGYDPDIEGDFSFLQPDGENTFSEILHIVGHIDVGATLITILSMGILLIWNKIFKGPKKNILPAALVVVIIGTLANEVFKYLIPSLYITSSHLVTIPVITNLTEAASMLRFPNLSALSNFEVYVTGVTIAIVASLETLLNLEATDKLDPQRRQSPANRELVAQGIGNIVSGSLGGIPITSVIVRSSANINSGARSKSASIIHGILLIVCVLSIPYLINKIPLSCLAAILLATGYKLASFSVFKDMFRKGWVQFTPFLITIICIVFTDLLIGILCGLLFSLFFVIHNNFKNPFSYIKEKYHTGDTIRIELSQQVSFFAIPQFKTTLHSLPHSSQVILDASGTHFIDHDIIEIIKEFRDNHTSKKAIRLSLIGFANRFNLDDQIKHSHVVTKELQSKLTPSDVLTILKEGNERFKSNKQTTKDLQLQLKSTFTEQYPLAAIISCIDSRTPVEPIFDLGIGDVFSIRIAGNIINDDILGSLEYACNVIGSKLIVVLGHTNCGAIRAACDNYREGHITAIIDKIKPAVSNENLVITNRNSSNPIFLENVTKLNVINSIKDILLKSPLLADLINKKEVMIVGGIYHLENGEVEFIENL